MRDPLRIFVVWLFAGIFLIGCTNNLFNLHDNRGENHSSLRQSPNIIVILADDLRADFLGFSGHPIVKTPNLDQLAENGFVFQNAFATSPICTPSRTSLLTGTYERKHAVNFQSKTVLSEEAFSASYPRRLQAAGYHVSYIGKNHTPVGQSETGYGYNSNIFEKAFDAWFGNHRHTRFYPKDHHTIYEIANSDTQIEILSEGAEAALSRESRGNLVEAVMGSRPDDQPFAILINLNVPHNAGTGSMEQRPTDDALYRTTYRDRVNEFPIPQSYLAESDIETPKIPVSVYNGEYISSYDYVKTQSGLREQMVRIAQTVTGIDRMVGDIVSTLKANGDFENTIIIFTSDHGIQLGEHGLGGKALLYEESIRVPLLISVPRQYQTRHPTSVEEIVALIDIAPTILDYAGLKLPSDMHGKSMRPLIDGTSHSWREDIFLENLYVGQNYPRIEAIRSDRYKYIRYFDKTLETTYVASLRSSLEGEAPIYEEFYDLKTDPLEQSNLINSLEHADLVSSYRSKITDRLAKALE